MYARMARKYLQSFAFVEENVFFIMYAKQRKLVKCMYIYENYK